jgi:hypothetical protein
MAVSDVLGKKLPGPSWWWSLILVLLICGAAPALSQPAPSQLRAEAKPSATSSGPSALPALPEAGKAQASGFQARINAAALALRDSNPRFKNLSPQYVQGIAEFVSGNMLFVLLHEMAHTAITQMGLPVLGRMEDAADSFAAVRLIKVGSDFSSRVLTEAARGWFLADRRDQKTGDKVEFYDEHGLNQQRAYEIVCLMVGSDDEKFKDLAKQSKLPESRQETCAGDYSNAAYSWDLLLKPHRRAPDQPKTDISVVYGPAEGRLATARQVATSIRLLDAVAARASEDFAWPEPFTLEMQTCGFPNARWDLPSRKLTVCYELAGDFAELYRDYGGAAADGIKVADSAKRKNASVATFKSTKPARKRKK